MGLPLIPVARFAEHPYPRVKSSRFESASFIFRFPLTNRKPGLSSPDSDNNDKHGDKI